MAKGNMAVSGGGSGSGTSNGRTVDSLNAQREYLSKQVQGMSATSEREELINKINRLDIEITHRKDEAIEEETILKKVSPEVRKEVRELNQSLLDNDLSRESLNNLRRRASKEQDNLREQRVDAQFEFRGMSTSDSGYATKKSELDNLNSRIDDLTTKMNSYQNRIKQLIDDSADLRRKKQSLLSNR